MAFFDKVQRCSFGGLEFPIDSIDVHGGLRDHVHEPPHSDGGIPEKLGRRLYTIKLHAIFDEGLGLTYPDLYPDTLWKLRILFEAGSTEDLVLPNLGTIKAYCTNWPQRWSYQSRSGETADLEFREDPQNTVLSVFNLNEVPDTTAMNVELDTFAVEAQAQADRLAAQQAITTPGTALDLSQCSLVDPNAVAQIKSVFGEIAALRGAADLALTQVDMLVLALQQYSMAIDQQITSPLDYAMLYALQDMTAMALAFQQNASNTLSPLKTYTTPRRMTIMEVAAAIYGDTSRSFDILNLNAISDAFNIPGRTNILYEDDSSASGNTTTTAPASFYRAAS